MALTNIETTIILDLYDHDTTPTKIKAIALDSKTRYVLASLRNNGNVYDAGQNTTVTLTIIRPDNVGVQITGETRQIVDLAPEGEVTVYGVYAELSQAALAVKGTLRAQFKLVSGEQILRTEIFTINNGEALDATIEEWAGDLDGHNLDEMAEQIEDAAAAIEEIQGDVSELKEGLSPNVLTYKTHDASITDSKNLAQNKIHNINTSWYTDLATEFGSPRMGILIAIGLETQKHYQTLLFDNGTMYQRYITANNASVGNWMPVQDQKCQVINTIGEMSNVTADKVLVLHNNSSYGDGGPCYFEVMDNVTENCYARKDGKKMCPMLDQAPLLTSAPPVEKMMGLMASYLENDALVYNLNSHTLFDEETTNEIDCSSFVSAILNGISYYGSKYTTGTNRRICKIASYAPVKTNIFGHLKSRQMAQYFAEHKWLHSMPTTYQMRNVLQFGDILFTGSGSAEAENRYLKIDHVFFVLGILNNTYVIVAQCGSCPSEITKKNNTNDVGKISMINLSNTNINTYVKAFARIPYINEHEQTFTGNKIKPIFIPNTYIDGESNGELSSSAVCATSYGYISVLPNSVLTFTGKTSHNDKALSALVAEYDGKFQYLSKTNFTTSPKTLSASTRYIRLCYSHTAGSDNAMLLDDCDQFEATIS